MDLEDEKGARDSLVPGARDSLVPGPREANAPEPTSPLFSWVKAELKTKPDRAPRALLLLEGAKVLEKLGRVGEAAKAMVAAANSDPLLLPAVWGLLDIFLRRNSWKNVIRLRQAEQKAAQSSVEKACALVSWGELKEDREGDLQGAATAFSQATEAMPQDRVALLSQQRVALQTGDLGALTAVLSAQVELTTDDRRKALLLVELARLREEGEGGAATAVELLRTAATIDAGQWHWLGALATLGERSEIPTAVAEAFEGRARIMARLASGATAADVEHLGAPPVASAEDAAAIAAAYYRSAARVRETLGDRAAALEDIVHARALLPEDRLALEAHLRLLERAERWQDVSTVISERLAVSPECDDAALLHLRLAEVAARSGESERAAEHFRQVLAATPKALVAAVGLQEMLAASSRWDELVKLLETQAAGYEADEPELCAALLVRAADVCDRELKDQAHALSLLERALRLAPHPELVRSAMISHYSALGKWSEVAGLLALTADAAGDDPRAVGYLAELAMIQQGQLGNPAGAASTYGMLLARSPEALWALVLQAEIFSASQRWIEAADAFRRMADLDIGDDQAAACAAVAGWLYSCRAEKYQEARECFRFTLERRPDSPLAAAGLEELARHSEDTVGLKRLLRERADQATTSREIERVLLGLALEHERVGELDAAITICRELIDRADGSWAGHLALMRSLRRAGRWEELTAAIDAALPSLTSSTDKGALLLELAELHLDRLGDPTMAEDALRRAREADAQLLPAVLLLADCARANTSWAELDELLRELLRLAPEAALLVAEERLALAAGAGHDEAAAQVISDVLLENIPDHRPALLWKALLGAQRDDAAARIDGWRRLAQIEAAGPGGVQLKAYARTVELIATGATTDVVAPAEQLPAPLAISAAEYSGDGIAAAMLERRCELSGEPRTRAFWELELADALEREGQVERARDLYGRVLEASPSNMGALEGLRRVSSSLGRWDEFAATSEQLAEQYRDAKVAAGLWAEAATSWALHSQDAERTELACRRALALEPAQPEAFGLLMALLRERGDKAAQIELLERRTGVVDEPTELVAMLVAQAGLHRDLNQFGEAAGCLETAVLVDPSNREALRGRGIMDHDAGRYVAAVSSLGEWAPTANEEVRRQIHWRRAELLDQKLDDPEFATQPLLELVNLGDIHPDTYRRLIHVARRAKAWDVAALAAGRLADSTGDDEERLDALRAQGILLQSFVKDGPRALEAWKRVIEVRPNDVRAIEALMDLTPPEQRAELTNSLTAFLQVRLRVNPTEAKLLRTLAKVRALGGSRDGLFCTLQVLDALGQATDQEVQELRNLQALAPPGPQRPLTPDGIARIRHPEQSGLAEQLHQLIAPLLSKVYAADAQALRLGKAQRPRGADLLVERCQNAGEVFGIQQLVLKRSEDPAITIVAVPESEPTIAMGPQLGPDLPAEGRFLLGRAVWHLLAGTSAFAQRTETQIRALHDAAIKEGNRDFQPTERRLGVDALQREIHRNLPRRLRRPLSELAAQLAHADEESMLRWCRAVKLSSDRAGLLLAGDLRAALPVIVPGWTDTDSAQRARLVPRVEESTTARDLFVFALSDDYLNLRREVGLAIEIR
jgi:tetratricopeptide (TPR) repeat protein